MKYFLLSLGALAILSACSPSADYTSPLPKKMPDDFNISLKYGVTMANELNTYENTYTKDLISDGTASTEMPLTEDERLFIYEKLRSVDLLALPTQMGSTCVVPFERYDLMMTADGEELTFEWDTSCDTEKLNKWEEVMKDIHKEIIYKRSEYQELPEASGGYL
ncbi:hypothetical protein [Alkalicoccobacillus porphyridii]|uniref:Lipoprotein n=1 Tax=Alkalicoccobacillus porphyridii TaxID=2597270 RepID=A0A553ZVQ9_9BACI|nr:hypothetical protein [Alkalicoccobacillus porphyridii]TSB45559.1 hypothetical protein FN960_15430 [Alkalicoccobacillus porphyridii]